MYVILGPYVLYWYMCAFVVLKSEHNYLLKYLFGVYIL